MKHKFLTTLAFVILTMVIAATTARAQTTANGPYYAWPSWDQQLPAATRFIVLSNFGGAAVLDRETGLVWARVAGDANGDGATNANDQQSWSSAKNNCTEKLLGNRRGWRLPAIQELASLVDPTQSNPALPSSHPFINVQSAQSALYWSMNTVGELPTFAWGVRFNSGGIDVQAKSDGTLAFGWCVRGGQGSEIQ